MVALYQPLSFMMAVGYGLIIFALLRLAPYHKHFQQCFYVSFLSLPFAGYYTVYGLAASGVMSQPALFTRIGTAVDWLYFAYTLLLQLLLVYAIFRLTVELEITPLQPTALRNLIFLAVYYVLYGIARMPLAIIQNNVSLLALPVTILRFTCIFCNLWLFYGCYRVILPEGSDATPQLPKLMKEPRFKEK